MNHITFLYWSVIFISFLCSGTAAAAQYQHNINVFAQYTDAHFVELDNAGDPINEEDGSLLFSGLGIYWQFDSGLFTEVSYKAAGSDLTYRGLSQWGFFIESETEYFIRDAYVLLGRQFDLTGVYMGLSNRYRERNIIGKNIAPGVNIAGAYEELESTYGIFGLQLNLLADRPFQIRFDGRISADLKSDLYVVSGYDPATIRPGKQLMVMGSVEFLFGLGGGLTLSIIPSYEYVHIDESDSFLTYQNGRPADSIHHPETEYETLSLNTKLSWYF
jgi:hypothetical protein